MRRVAAWCAVFAACGGAATPRPVAAVVVKTCPAAGSEDVVVPPDLMPSGLVRADVAGDVTIDSIPSGATVAIGRYAAFGRTPWRGYIEGDQTLVLKAAGYSPTVVDLGVARPVDAAPRMVADGDMFGGVLVDSNVEGASISVDGQPTTMTTPARVRVLRGEVVEIEVAAPGFAASRLRMEVPGGKEFRRCVTLTPLPAAR